MGALAGIAFIAIVVGILFGAWLVALHDERADTPDRWPHPAGSARPRHPDDAA